MKTFKEMQQWKKTVAMKSFKDFLAESFDTTLRPVHPVKHIPLDNILRTEGPHSKHENRKQTKKYVDDLKSGKKVPPIMVARIKSKMMTDYYSLSKKIVPEKHHTHYLVDGHHRHTAYKLLGKKTIPAYDLDL